MINHISRLIAYCVRSGLAGKISCQLRLYH